MICASCEKEVDDNISVFHSPEKLDNALLGVIVVCQPCGEEIITLLRARGIVLDPTTGELLDEPTV